jgi:arsenite oxidase small subunit
VTRRDFFKILVGAGVASMAVAAASSLRYFSFIPQPTTPSGGIAQLAWPRVKVVNISNLQPLKAWTFNYPVVDTSNLIVKLGERATNGVGPDGDIVAYSMICQHLGGFVNFYAPGQRPPCSNAPFAPVSEGYCCLHGGGYDFTRGAAVIHGPPPRPIPPVKLEYDDSTGDIYAVGMGTPTIFSKIVSGVNPDDPDQVLSSDLQGGEIVTQDTVGAKEL